MRSRYTAYAVGDLAHLWRTWAPERRPADARRWNEEVRAWCEAIDLVGLAVFGSEVAGEQGRVRFFARIVERGVDVSFGEDSRFRREDGRWLYVDGARIGPEGAPVQEGSDSV